MSKDKFTASAYHKMTAAQKRDFALSVCEAAVSCPVCDTHVMPVDLLSHLAERCKGPRPPGPASKWVTWREAVPVIRRALAVTARAAELRLARWAQPDRHGVIAVRSRGGRGDRQYLLGDLAKHLAKQSAAVVGTLKTESEGPAAPTSHIDKSSAVGSRRKT